jgi:hypothetical protein
MAWEKHKPFTHDAFCKHVYNVARETMRGLRSDPIGGFRYLPYWWLNNEVRVFWEPSVPRQTVDLIVQAVDERARETVGLQFDFQLYGNETSSAEQVSSALVHGHLDPDRLFALSVSEPWRDHRRGGRQHADIYITTKQFIDDSVSWAAACFKHGTMMFCLHGQRHQGSNFLRKVALHETNHLLGMYCHCDEYQNISGLPYTSECNMHYSCTHENLCSKCRTHIESWWEGVQEEAKRAGALE